MGGSGDRRLDKETQVVAFLILLETDAAVACCVFGESELRNLELRQLV